MFQHPVDVDAEFLEELAGEAYDWATGHGLVVHKKTEQGQPPAVTHAPFTILPSPVPQSVFRQAMKLGPDYNLLVHEISRKYDFILSTLENVPDDFTQRLLTILKTLKAEGIKQPVSFGIFRSDYMLHNPRPDEYVLQQVELNTISAAFPSLSTLTSQLHKYLVERFGLVSNFPTNTLPENNSLFAICRAMAHAFAEYKNLHSYIMMVVQPGERNKWDQRQIEYRLWQWHGLKVFRATLAEINEKGSLDKDRRLFVDGKEVALVYFRAGYSPNDYPSENEWTARMMVEKSQAVKCPNISYHLAGTKKMQQVIANPGVLESIITDKETAERMRASFTGLYSLSGPESNEIVQKAIENYKDYVLKPQREGGGNNIYNEDLKKALETMTESERSAYILMDRIRPPAVSTHVVRDGKLAHMNAVYELGIYSTILANEDKEQQIVENFEAGLLLRTKGALVEDGGVAAGVAVLDSPFLI